MPKWTPPFVNKAMGRVATLAGVIIMAPVMLVVVSKQIERFWPFIIGAECFIAVLPGILRRRRERKGGWPES